MNFKDKKVIVIGMAKSGGSAAIILSTLGADVTIQDLKEREELPLNLEPLEELGIKFYLGKNPDDIILDFDLVIMSPGVPCHLSFVKKAEENGVPVWSEIEFAYSICKAPIVAITGTNGKTTTTALAGLIFKNFISTAEIVGNIGIPFSEKAEEVPEDSCVIAELSSFQLEKIDKFKPIISAVLNISPDHLDRHKTMENYIAAKERIFENQDENDFLILNYDDEKCREMKNKAKSKVVFFSRMEKLEEGIYADEKSIYVNKLFGKEEKVIDIDEMSILGSHNVENAMAAIGMALCFNISLEIIRKSLIEFKAVEHRIEFVKSINNIEFYNDSKGTNTDASIKAILAMKRPILLIGGGYDKGSEFKEWIDSFSGKVKYMAVLGQVTEKICSAADEAGFENYERVDSLKEAVLKCFEKAVSGDCVLLSPACASWDMFKSYEERGELFKQYVNELR